MQQPEGRWAVRASENTEAPGTPARARWAPPRRLHAHRGLDSSYPGATAQGNSVVVIRGRVMGSSKEFGSQRFKEWG